MLKLEKIFKKLNESKVKYLLIGGLASILYGVPRTTIDIDIFIAIDKTNIKKTIEALKSLNFFCEPKELEEIIAQGGVTFFNEHNVDVLISLPGTDFHTLWNRKSVVKYHGTVINVISKKDHILLLKRIGRKKDLEDARVLSEE